MRSRILDLDIEAKHEHDFRRTILVVDDEPVNLRILGNMLAKEYDILYAQNAEEALKEIHSNKDFLSLILLDLYMGSSHGYDVLQVIMSDEELKKIPVIVLTSDKDAEVESLRRGAVDFISKPFDRPEVIKARIRRFIELSIDRKLINSAGVDPLTGLLTVQFFMEYAQEYDRFHPDAEVDSIVVNFKKFHLINELYGKNFGNEVLCGIADGVRKVARNCRGVASRVDADHFYLYIEHQDNYDEIVDEIKSHLTPIMHISDIRLRMGIYQNLNHMVTLEQRFDRAKAACDEHTGDSGHSYTIYDNEMHEREMYEARLLENIDTALNDSQFRVVFQPKYDIRGEQPRLCSAEVLVRWQHPKFGNVRPDYFIPLFEENGLVNELDRFVWREAVKQVKRWKDMYGTAIPVSVNVSRVDIFDPDLDTFLENLIKEHGLSFDDIHLEITETAYADNVSQMIQIVRQLQEKGFKVEMDDFGKGYSSLNMLTSLPIDALKLDMGFIKDIAENNRELRMVEFIIEIGKFLGVPVIAEGVENKEQFQLLKKAGCDIIQGYYFSKPVSAAEFGCLIEKELVE